MLNDEELDILHCLLLPEDLRFDLERNDEPLPQLTGKREKLEENPRSGQTTIPSFYLEKCSKICDKCGDCIGTLPLNSCFENKKTGRMDLPVTLETGKGCKQWNERETTFVAGIIFDTLYQRGSLVPSKNRRRKEDLCWKKIKETYDLACVRYKFLTRTESSPTKCHSRSLLAIGRQFKALKSIVADLDVDSDEETMPMFRKLHMNWEQKYNQNKILTCSDGKFASFVEEFGRLSNHECCQPDQKKRCILNE